MLEPPPELPQEGILVGYSLEHERHTAPIGFVYGGREPAGRPPPGGPRHLTPILHTGGGHLLTIAPTGAGKGVSCIIPTLLRFPGPVIVIDPKGENYAVTAERRRALGQDVVVLDPMGITGATSPSALNPLDLIDPDGPQSIDDAAMLASLLGGALEKDDPRNVFWYQRGDQLLTGLIQYVASEKEDEERSLSEVRRLLNLPTEDFIGFSQSVLARASDPDVRQIAGTVVNPAQEMIGSIVGMAQNSLGFLRGDLLHRSTSRSTFDVDGITAGDPLSVFIVIPPDKLWSHRNLLRVWVGTLMSALMRRRAPVRHNTLFVLDEAAQLGPLDQLRQAITLLRGYGLQTWSFWQDHSQLSNLYPLDWQTMYNNCRVHQAFGFSTLHAATAVADLVGFHDPMEALRLDSDEMLLSVSGDETVIAQKPNYLTDPAFRGLYAPNPFYRQSPERPPAARRAQRRYRRPTRDAAAGSPSEEEAPEVPEADPEGGGLRALLDSWREARADSDLGRHIFAPDSDGGTDRRPGAGAPGGLRLLPHVQVVPSYEVPPLLDLVEAELGERWDRYRTTVRSLLTVFILGGFEICELHDPERAPARVLLLRRGNDLRYFRGGPGQLRALGEETGFLLKGTAIAQYLRLQLRFSRMTDPALLVVESPDELAYWTGRDTAELGDSPELLRPVGRLQEDDPRLGALRGLREASGPSVWMEGTALVGGDLHAFVLSVDESGELDGLQVERLREGVGPAPVLEPEVLATPGFGAGHGPWEVVSEPERGDVLSYLNARELRLADTEGRLFRRRVPCFPGVDLVRVPLAVSEGPALFFLYGGGIPWRLGFRELHDIGRELLSIRTDEDAEAFMRIFTWLRQADDYPIALLERPEHLDLLLEDGEDVEPSRRAALEHSWVPIRRIEVEDGEEDVYRFEFTLLEGRKVLAMTVTFDTKGRLLGATERPLADDLPVDPKRLASYQLLPVLGTTGIAAPEPGP